jgi:hypothetical protein
MDTKETRKCDCDEKCDCKKDKKSLTEKVVDSIQKDIAAIIKTVKETERS